MSDTTKDWPFEFDSQGSVQIDCSRSGFLRIAHYEPEEVFMVHNKRGDPSHTDRIEINLVSMAQWAGQTAECFALASFDPTTGKVVFTTEAEGDPILRDAQRYRALREVASYGLILKHDGLNDGGGAGLDELADHALSQLSKATT